jgi:CubicO group peptidase (beta-lactamase class C family)
MTPRTLFSAGSTTKSFTAAASSKLVYSNESQYKENDCNTRLVDLIRDDFVLQDEYATNHITITDAMSHRTSMPRHDVSWTMEIRQFESKSVKCGICLYTMNCESGENTAI